MKECIVIGAGFAGLSAASFLASSGIPVEVIESSPKIGGRAYSLYDEACSCSIDNGQHIMMGCYRETLNFLKLIGAESNFVVQDKLEVNFLKRDFNLFPLKTDSLLYPVNLAVALLNFKALSLKERMQMLRLFLKMPLIPDKDLSRLNVYKWLKNENQNENICRSFWDIICIGALNTDTHKASAQMFIRILKEIFFTGSKSAGIILAGTGLTEAYCKNAVNYINSKGGTVQTGEAVIRIKNNGKRITEIITSKRVIKNFNSVISAVPHYAFKKIFPELYPDLEFKYSSILSLHLWLSNNPLEKDFYGLIDSPLHWIFNHGSHITLVISNADHLISESKQDLFEMAVKELNAFTTIKSEDIIRYRVLKEKRATFIPSKEIFNKRPLTETSYRNLFLAGDWINTGLPSTIESAVKSGRMAADALI